jgi:hypothetical protein
MALQTWKTIKVRYCEHVGKQVGLEARLIYPAEFLPDQLPQIVAHRCSLAIACNLEARPSCIWAGTNPAFDPYLEK